MSIQVLNTGILSFGMSGRLFHAPFIDAHPGFTFSALVERREKKAQVLYPRITSYDSVKDLLEDKSIQLVIVNTPNGLHYEHAKAAMMAGKHVLVEKPATVSLAELNELYEIADKKGVHYLAYQNRRWDSDYQSIRQVIESNQLGNLIEVHFRYDRYKAEIEAKPFKESPDSPGNGLVYALGPHLLDQAISLFGKPISSHKITGINRKGSLVPDYFSYQLKYNNQLNVFLTSSLLVAHPLPAFVLHGTKGSYIKKRTDVQEAQLLVNMKPSDPAYGLEPEINAGELTIAGDDNKIRTEPVKAGKSNYMGLFEAVYQQIVNNQPYPVTRDQLRWQIELLEKTVSL
jgi:predicted dehydrogenase